MSGDFCLVTSREVEEEGDKKRKIVILNMPLYILFLPLQIL